MIILHKFLPFFVLPLGLTFILVLAGVLFRKRRLCLAGLALLWISATPVASDFFTRIVEGWEVRRPVADVPRADAIVVLGGGRTLAPGDPPVNEWRDADRFFGGVELYRAGKAPLLLFTGGWIPWTEDAKLEGRVLMDYASDLGIPLSDMLTTEEVVNTAEEAAAVSKLLAGRDGIGPSPRIILVTSAYHMRRARFLFERSGLRVEPFPVDFQVSTGQTLTILDCMPWAQSLLQTEKAMREVYGYWYYVLRDFVR